MEIGGAIGRLSQRFQGGAEHPLEVGEHGGTGEERQVPAGVMRHLRRVVERIAVRQLRRAPPCVAERPEFLEPAEVADLPQQRVHDRQPGTDPLPVVQVLDQEQRAGARVAKLCRE